MKLLMQRKRAALGKKSSQSNQQSNEPVDISQMTPYQKHMAYNRFASTVIDKDALAERRKMEMLMKKFIRNKKNAKEMRNTMG